MRFGLKINLLVGILHININKYHINGRLFGAVFHRIIMITIFKGVKCISFDLTTKTFFFKSKLVLFVSEGNVVLCLMGIVTV